MPTSTHRLAIRLALLFALGATPTPGWLAARAEPSPAAAPAEAPAVGESVDQAASDGEPATSDQPPASAQSPAATPPAPEKIAEWVAQLDDDHFAIRETAQQQLASAGAPALAKIGEAAAGGSLESSTRAVNVLMAWAQSADAELNLGALEQLAALKNRPAESAMAADKLADVRELAAIKAIVDQGGQVNIDQQVGAFNGVSQSLQVVIGLKWKGGLDGLSRLKDVRRASTVSFHSSTLGEEVVDAMPSMPQLLRIEFYGVEVSPESLEKLKKQAPNAMVEMRSGARLGIVGMHAIMGAPAPVVPGVTGAPVKDVLPGSCAAKAGIQPGDVITEFKGQKVDDFPHLTSQIAKCQPDDKVELKVLRQTPGQPAKTIDMTVVFDRWGDEAAAAPGLGLPARLDANAIGPFGMPRGTIIINQRR